MTTQSGRFGTTGTMPNAEAALYTAEVRSIIDKLTCYNRGASATTVTIKILDASATTGNEHILAVKTLQPGESYTFPEIVGHPLEVGDSVREVAGAANSINRRMGGRRVT